MQTLYMDCSFGVAGDMFLAACAGLGADIAPLADALRAAGVDADFGVMDVRVGGLAGKRLDVEAASKQPLRHLPEILEIIERLEVSAAVREKSACAFRRLAEVEAGVHGMSVDEVHFHEVGAVDTLIDVTGAFYALETLGVTRVECSPLPWFRGRVECAHGTLPLPAPAALELMRGKPVFPTDFELEIITPTGALIVDSVVDAFVKGPEGIVVRTASGYGTHDLGPRNKGLRLMLVDPCPGA